MGGEKYRYIAYSGVIVFILAIAYFGISIYAIMIRGEQESENEFSTFVQQANIHSYMSLQRPEDFERYYQDVKNAVDQNSYIAAVVFSEQEVPVFAYPLSSNVIQITEENEPILLSSSPMLKTHSMSILGQNSSSGVLYAVMYILRPEDIYNSARISFLIILAYTLFLIVVIVYISLSHTTPTTTMRIVPKREASQIDVPNIKERETIPVVFKEKESSWDDFFVGVQDNENPLNLDEDTNIHDVGEEPNQNDVGSEYDIAQTDNEDGFKLNFVDEYMQDEINTENKTESVPDAQEKVEDIEDSTVPHINDPMGLFSDVTGVGWESYLETRLDSELSRATSSEQDLALVFIQIKGIDQNVLLKKKIATLLLKCFKYRDFVFEYKSDGFAGIMLDINLDQSMLLCEELYNLLQRLLDTEGVSSPIGIGLSTRALRMLPGSRIITEASEAVARSFIEEDVPIVAFRVSPEKYRQYVSNSLT